MLPAIVASGGTIISVTYSCMLNASKAPEGEVLDGISRHPMSTMNINPAAATANPTGENSNMPNGGAFPMSFLMVAITMLGGVPIAVISPPSSDPKANGINKKEGDLPVRLAVSIATGIINTNAPTLFINAESKTVRPVRAAS